jgi:hypothetical protein
MELTGKRIAVLADDLYDSMIKFFLLAILASLVFKALYIREVSL